MRRSQGDAERRGIGREPSEQEYAHINPRHRATVCESVCE